MNGGKSICNQLKAVRRRIAEENGIPLEIEECTYKGECRGTCPRCEAEVQFLESSLADRLRLGKAATVAGMALALAGTAAAQAVDIGTPLQQDGHTVNQQQGTGTLKGCVRDGKTKEPLPFATVAVRQGDEVVKTGVTDFDGMYTIKPLAPGDYTLVVSAFFGPKVEFPVYVREHGFTVMDVSMAVDSGATISGERTGQSEPMYVIGEFEQSLSGTPASQAEPLPSLPQLQMPGNPPSRFIDKDGVMVIVR